MATHLRIPIGWIYFAVLVLVSFVHVPTYAQCVHSPTFTFTDELCPNSKDGTVTVTVEGGTPPFAFNLERRVDLTNYVQHQLIAPVADRTYTFTGLSKGSYRVQVFDSQIDECGPTAYVYPILKTLGTTPADISINGEAEVCQGQNGITYSVPVTAGSSYTWNVPAGATITSGATGPENNTIIVSFGSSSGAVTVVETNSGGCSGKEARFNVTVVPAPAQYTLSTTDPVNFCTGSTGATLRLSNSVLGNTYVLLRNGVEVASLAGTGSALSFGTFNTSGTYTATAYITSRSSCTAVMDGAVTLNATSPAVLTNIVSDVKCAGATNGAIDLTITGGTAPFTILWNNGAITEDLSNLGAGTYTVRVSDANGCEVSQAIVVNAPQPITLPGVITQITCFEANNGSIDITTTGGTAPYTYQWSNGQTTEDISGLDVGSYTIIIRDANNCEATERFEISEPAQLTASATATQQVSCNGGNEGAINLTVAGGTAPYTYAWSNSSSSKDLSNLVAGTYTVTVTDANNCTATTEATISQPVVLSSTVSVNPATTCGGNEGSVDLEVAGGTAPYSYAWSNGSATQDLTALPAGTYKVVITDNNGCILEASATVTQPAGISSLSATPKNVSCFGLNDGALNLTVTGGTAPYTYAWSTGATTKDITNLAPGSYSVTVTDATKCQLSQEFEIVEPQALALSAQLTHVACAGVNMGAIDLVVTGGTAPYTYAWSNGARTQDISDLAAGSYTIVIEDSNGCSATANYTINEGVSVSLSEIITPVSCNGQSNGAINITVESGTAPYTYTWNTGATTEDLTELAAGRYTVLVTDANGCAVSKEITVSQPDVLALRLNGSDATTCGGNEGGVVLTVSGGTASYTYLWSNGATTKDVSNLIAGTYEVTVTDARQCSAKASVTIGQPAGISSVTALTTNVSCNGLNNGSLVITVNGGAAPYTYNWNNGASTKDISGLAQGTYQVTVTDAANCPFIQNFEISQPAVLAVAADITQLVCNADANGQINISVSGGTAPYTYSWSTGAATEDLANLVAGIYKVTVLDANGCQAEASYTINEGATVALSASVSQNLCNGNTNGRIDLTVAGGQAPYTYSWSNGADTEDLMGLAAGRYTVSVVDANNCSATASYDITEPAAISLSTTLKHISTCGSSNGAIDLTIAGGTAPYTYAWSNGATRKDLTGLRAGEYTVTVTDANECQIQATAVITEPIGITAVEGVIVPVACFGTSTGAIDITVSGGVAPYTHSWNTGAATEDLSGLAAGTYSVKVTDSNKCEFTNSFTITEPAGLNLSAQLTQVSCKGAATGAIDLTINGGTAAYRYNWSNGASTQDLIDVVAGVYTVIVTDANGCSQTAEYLIGEPENALVASATATSVSCNGGSTGSIDLTVSGGVVNYTYLWSNGATTEDLTNVAAGTYTVDIRDAGGCVVTASAIVSEPTPLTATVGGTTSVCPGAASGRLTVAATGGAASYTYQWNTGETSASIENLPSGTYTVMVTDVNGCTVEVSHMITEPAAIALATLATNLSSCSGSDGAIDLSITTGGVAPFTYLWSTGATTEDISNLSAGTYSVTVTDANGCSQTASASVTQPAVLTLTATATNATSCGGTQGSVDVAISGGVAPYTYSWNTGAATEDLSGLAAGTYSLVVIDANGCSATISATVTEPSSITGITAVTTNVVCNGLATGSINLTVTGGLAPYTYLWSNGATTEDLISLVAGEYSVSVRDANGCRATANFIISEPAAIILAGQSQSTSSCGATDGTLDLTVTGGTAPYTYGWSNGGTTQNISGLAAGNYSVTVTDANGCTQTASYSISDGNAPTLTASIRDLSCIGATDGAVDLTVTGGATPYTYLWSNGTTTEDQINLAAGEYSITLTDANGCITAATYVITEPAAIALATLATNLSSCSGSDGAIDLSITTGGVAPFTYLWSTGATTEDISNLSAGTYSVTVTDANGCSQTASASVTQPAVLTLTATATNATSCDGTQGSVDVAISGGVAPYTYSWNTGAATEDLSGLAAGTYSLVVTDANGCSATISATVTEPSSITGVTAVTTNVVCNGLATGSINLTVTGGLAPYTYLWSNGATTEDLSALVAGEYSVSVRDANGCRATANFIISEPAAIILAADVENTTACQATDGAINLSTSGGDSPYTYSWSNGAVTKDISGLAAGVYTVRVTDANGCEQTGSFAVNDANAPVLAVNVQQITCYAAANGAIDVTVSGGTAPYTYSWNTGAVSEDLDNLVAGNYAITVTDANGCSASAAVAIQEPAEFTATAVATAVSCHGTGDGSIALAVSGGVAPYQFNWTKDGVAITAATEDLSNLTSGAYSVTITDANGCTVLTSAIVNQPMALAATISGTSSLCGGVAEGTLTVVAGQGTTPYAYLWNTGATTATINNLAAGTYSVTVTDANNCSTTISHTISETMIVVNLGADVEACKPAEIILNAGFSSDTHKIVWSKSDGSMLQEDASTITVNSTDTYSVTVTDRATGCSATDAILVEIEDEFVPTVSIELVEEFTCNSSELVFEAVYTRGGTAPTFVWKKNGYVVNGATSNILRLAIGTFEAGDDIYVAMTSSLECAAPRTVATDDEDEMWDIVFPEVRQPVLSSYTESACQGRTMPTFTSTDGESLNWYQGMPGGTPLFVGVSFTPTEEMLQLGDNTFYATYRSVLCENPHISFNVNLKGADECGPACEVNPTVAVRILPGKEICDDIKTLKLVADVNQVGENATYAWFFNGASSPFSTEASPVFTAEDGFATGDVFKVAITITDEAFICDGKSLVSAVESITIMPEVQATARIQPIDGVCADSSTPVTLVAAGQYIDWRLAGLAARYTWYIGTEEVKSSLLDTETSTANQLEIVPGQLPANAQVRLVVTLPEGISCVLAPAEVTYNIPFAQPVAPTVSLNTPAGACPGATVTFTATATNAGTSPTFIFLVDGTQVQSGTSANLVLDQPVHGQRVQVRVEVTNTASLCLSSRTATSEERTIQVRTTEECVGGEFNCGVFGAELTSFTRPSCGERNGALFYKISGNSPSYFIRTTFGGEKIEQVVDETSFILAIERIPAGEVTIYMQDSKGNECSLTTILEPEPRLDITFEKSTNGDVLCYGEATGRARLMVTGGNAPYQYMLEGTTEWVTLNGNSLEFSALPAGIINILVRDGDADACPAVASLEILNVNSAIEIVTSVTQQANCNDNVGAFSLNSISGGSVGNGYRVKLITEDNWRDYTPGMLFSGLARGRHTLIITDGVCEVNKQVVVPSPGLIALTEDSGPIEFSCENPELRNGLHLKIDATITEIAGPYIADIFLMNAAGTYDLISRDEIFNGRGELYKFYLERGTYQVEVRSQNREGCPEIREFVIEGSEIPDPITFVATPLNIYCADAIGGIQISQLKGAAGLPYMVEVYKGTELVSSRTITPFEYATQQSWDITGLDEELYKVIIKQDQGLCTTIEQSKPAEVIIIEIQSKLSVTLSGTTVSLPERATGTLSFRIGNGTGTAPYEASLVWKARLETQEDWAFESYGDPVPMNGMTGKYDFTYTNLPPGEYELTVTDSKGCSVVLTETVGFDTNVFVPNFISPNGDGKNEVFYIRNKAANTQLIITNRWGKVVYESKSYNNDWDGGSLPEGLYYYSIKMPNVESGGLKGWLQIKRGAKPF